jgi:multicomponent Na+:H+ antiporter subunit G
MDVLEELLALVAVIVGTAFSIVGALGMLRLPDVYTRLHATGKVSVFGVVLLLVAAVAITPLGLGKGLVLIGLLVITGPAASHALSSAAYRLGIPMRQAIRDDLAARIVPPAPDADEGEEPRPEYE